MSVLRMSGFWQVFRDPKNHLNFVVFCQYNGQVPRKFPAFLEKLAQFLELTIPFCKNPLFTKSKMALRFGITL